MPERDFFRRLIEWALPWFDPDRHQRELLTTQRVLTRAERVMAEVQRVEHVIRGVR
jgi:hypothetical protein